VKTLTKIEAALTILFLTVVIAGIRASVWLKSMPESDPARQHWERILLPVGDTVWLVTFFPWAAFTVFYLLLAFMHLAAWFFRTVGPGEEHEAKN